MVGLKVGIKIKRNPVMGVYLVGNVCLLRLEDKRNLGILARSVRMSELGRGMERGLCLHGKYLNALVVRN